jgi:hypothetical protein
MAYGYGEARTRDGRLVLIGNVRRVAHVNRQWGYFNQVTVVWVSEEREELSRETISLGQFNKAHRPISTGHRCIFDAGTKRYVAL